MKTFYLAIIVFFAVMVPSFTVAEQTTKAAEAVFDVWIAPLLQNEQLNKAVEPDDESNIVYVYMDMNLSRIMACIHTLKGRQIEVSAFAPDRNFSFTLFGGCEKIQNMYNHIPIIKDGNVSEKNTGYTYVPRKGEAKHIDEKYFLALRTFFSEKREPIPTLQYLGIWLPKPKPMEDCFNKLEIKIFWPKERVYIFKIISNYDPEDDLN